MRIELKNKVQSLVNAYHEAVLELTNKIKQWEKDTIYSDEHKQDRIKQLQQEITQYDSLFNGKMKSLISEEKKVIIGEPIAKPADYQMQINNALEFIKLAGKNLTDDQLFKILKPFQNDFETMNLFQAVVANLGQGDLYKSFTKTFEQTNKFLALVNSLEFAVETSKDLFNSKDINAYSVVKSHYFLDSINTIEELVNNLELLDGKGV